MLDIKLETLKPPNLNMACSPAPLCHADEQLIADLIHIHNSDNWLGEEADTERPLAHVTEEGTLTSGDDGAGLSQRSNVASPTHPEQVNFYKLK